MNDHDHTRYLRNEELAPLQLLLRNFFKKTIGIGIYPKITTSSPWISFKWTPNSHPYVTGTIQIPGITREECSHRRALRAKEKPSRFKGIHWSGGSFPESPGSGELSIFHHFTETHGYTLTVQVIKTQTDSNAKWTRCGKIVPWKRFLRFLLADL